MQASGHNIISAIEGTDNYVIVNILSGHADIISKTGLTALDHPDGGDFPEHFIKKGYVADPAEEELRYRMAYVDFLERRENEEVQVFFIPTYLCNFDCSYCYQAPYPETPDSLSKEVTDAFFHYLDTYLDHRQCYITLFGGEPLLPGKAYRDSLSYFLQMCKARHLDLAVVTNGYHLAEYLDRLSEVNIREIQVTLDGTEAVHNSRRKHKSTGKSFSRIVSATDQVLDAGIPVNMRVVVDKQNMQSLPGLARYAIDKGWTQSPLFKTQLGRNYELHHCHSAQNKLYTRLSLYSELYKLVQQHPEILEFHRPAYSISRFLKDNGHLPDPLFDACPACKSEWAFDHLGKIYSCTATAGKPGEELGTFYPEVTHIREKIKTWQQRDVCSIDACRQCNLRLACGGGCGAMAKNSRGSILEPDCRPVTELVSLGIAQYFNSGS